MQSKLNKLRSVLTEEGIFDDPKMRLLVFTEHKDTLDYLAGDGQDGRPLGKLREWGLTLTQIHGGMKIGDRDTPGSRIYAEREFKESAQVLVATEAAGEGINLQFCWLMINFDIPWNPVRLEQRVGRIHRYGQEKDCLIFNFVAQNTREGRVLQKLLERLKPKSAASWAPTRCSTSWATSSPSNQLEKLFRDMYARITDEHEIQDRIVRRRQPGAFPRRSPKSTLEGLAKKELNLSAIVGKSAEAKERRLVPEVIEDVLRPGRAPRPASMPKRQPPSPARLSHRPRAAQSAAHRRPAGIPIRPAGPRVRQDRLQQGPAAEGSDPGMGHARPSAVRGGPRAIASTAFEDHLRRGAVFFDLHRRRPAVLDVFAASIKDGRGNTLHRRLFVVETGDSGEMRVHEPTILHEITPAPAGTPAPADISIPDRTAVEQFLYQHALEPWIAVASQDRTAEVTRVERHVQISLNALIDRQQLQLAEFLNRQVAGQTTQGLDGIIAQAEQHLDELNNRLENRKRELELERHCTISDITHLGRAWVLPHPERTSPQLAPMVRDDEIERIAVDEAIRHEEARGWVVESVESENRGFDLISRRPHPEDSKTFIEVRFIEVKGRAGVGVIALTENEYRTADRLKKDYWLYVVFKCAATPEVHPIQDPARLGWKPIVTIEHYHLGAASILAEKMEKIEEKKMGEKNI